MTSTSSTRGWVLAVLALLAAGANMPSPLYSTYQQQFGFTDLTLTAVYAVYALVSVPALVLVGPIGDRLPPRLVLRAGVAVAAAGSLCLAFATSLPWLVAGRVAYGLALGTVTGVGMALVARIPGRRGAAATAGSVAFLLGSAAGPAVTGALAQYGPAPFVLPFVLHLALLAALFVGLGSVGDHAPALPGVGAAAAPRPLPAPLSPARRRVLLVAAGNGFLGWTVTGMFLALVPSAVERTLGVRDLALSGGVAGAVLAWSAVAPAALRRLGVRRGQLLGLGAMLVPLLVLATGVGSLAAILVACSVAGLAHGLLFGGAADLASAAIPPERAGGLTARVNVAFYLGAGLPTLVAGVATTRVPLATAVSLMAVVVLVGCLAMVRPTMTVDRARRLTRSAARSPRSSVATGAPRRTATTRPSGRPGRPPSRDRDRMWGRACAPSDRVDRARRKSDPAVRRPRRPRRGVRAAR